MKRTVFWRTACVLLFFIVWLIVAGYEFGALFTLFLLVVQTHGSIQIAEMFFKQ